MKRLLWLLLLCLPFPAAAEERILSFHSVIEVFENGSMQVTETIRVRAEGKQIRQGIFRDFPTDYKDRFGNRYQVEFEVLEASRDGRSENFRSLPQGNGIRTYLGRKGDFLPPADYSYTLTYRTDRQLGFFKDHDELYWNVTGNEWAFPIDQVSAQVLLPTQIPGQKLQPEAYTGGKGEKGQDYRATITPDGIAEFVTTRALARGEGLTLVVAWPKGYLAAPTLTAEAGYLLRDNRAWLVALAGLLLVAGYYLMAWYRVGRDPAAGVVIPRYEPPQGFSPASARYIREMGYDDKVFATALVNLAVKGLLQIHQNPSDDKFTLLRTARLAEDLAAGEKVLLKSLFPHKIKPEHIAAKRPVDSLKLTPSNHRRLSAALNLHQESLKKDYAKRFFVTNRSWLIPGLVLSVLVYALTIFSLNNPDKVAIAGFFSLWLSGWTFGVVMLGRKTWLAWRGARGLFGIFPALFITLFFIPFFGSEVYVLYLLGSQVSPALPLALLLMIGLNLLFFQLLKAPTRLGRRLLDSLDGFRLYLDVAEKDEMNLRHPPQKTTELFEKYLPYALALDVEQRWAEKFAQLFSRLTAGEAGTTGTRPTWYRGHSWSEQNLASLAAGLGSSLSAAVSASSTAPGSSSGSGGGGGGW